MINIELKRKGITAKFFLLIFLLIVLTAGIISFWFISGTSKIVQIEIGTMRGQVLDEIANNISMLLSNVEIIGDNIVVDSKLIDILNTSKENLDNHKNVNKERSSYVEGLLNDQVWKYGKYNMKPELYIVGTNGEKYSTYSKTKYDLKNIEYESWYEEIVKADGETVLVNTYKDENGIGPYKNIFKMGRLIKDLISNKTLGVLIMDISETMLYDRYDELLDLGMDVYIVDSNGKVISSKDKRNIGMNYNSFIKSKHNENNIFRNDIEIVSNINEYDWRIIQEVPLNIINQVSQKIFKGSFMIITLVIMVAFILTYRLSIWIANPIINMKNKMKEVMDGNLKVNVEISSDDEIGELQLSFNEMIKKVDILIEDIKRYEKQKREAELSFLQAQINPHFLYNTLSGIRFLIAMNNIEQGEEMLYRFTKLLRSILPKASEMVTIEEEIENIKNYVELQKIRYPNAFQVNYDIDEQIENFKVPSFILQPIVENAILYSMEKENNSGVIDILGYKNEEGIRIAISDNGVGMSQDKVIKVLNKEASINRVGVINVHERVQLTYGQDYGLKIESVEDKGTKIIFILPS